jgi:hypothetical protein
MFLFIPYFQPLVGKWKKRLFFFAFGFCHEPKKQYFSALFLMVRKYIYFIVELNNIKIRNG